MMKVSDIRQYFKEELEAQRFTVDRSGAKTIEMLGASFFADEEAIFGEVNWDYVYREFQWYDSMSTNIYDLSSPPPKAWEYTANEHGEINSNYGRLIFSELYHNQYDNVLAELLANPNSRRATMVYNRPSIWLEAIADGKNDFICTNAVSYYIRDEQLHCVVQMRSNDVVYGYKNDRAWQQEIQHRLIDDLNVSTDRMFEDDIMPGTIIWQVQNLHVYEKHFKLVK
jgi:thymidylate synthase